MPHLLAAEALRARPALLGAARHPATPEVKEFSQRARSETLRRLVENGVYRCMDAEGLRVFLGNAAKSAAKSWNAEQSILGRIFNRLTVSHPGYAAVPGTIFQQLQKLVGERCDDVDRCTTYLLRADIIAVYYDLLSDAREQSDG